jgi:hypothetical protein
LSPSREVNSREEMTLAPSATDDTSPNSSTSPLEHNSIRRSNRSTKGQFRSTKFEDEFYLTSLSNGNCPSQCAQLAYTASLITCPDTGHVDNLDPQVFLARNGGNHDSDSPTFYEAMNGPQSKAYMEAMKVEIEALE